MTNPQKAGDNGMEWVLVLHPMETAPTGDDVMEPAEIEIHEGSWAIVLGTNAKPVGWIDTHATFAERIYRDRVLPPPPSPAGNDLVEGFDATARGDQIAMAAAAISALSAIVHMQSGVTKAQFREAAADALEAIGKRPADMADQSPFVLRAETAEARISSLSSELEKAREALKPFANRQFHATMVDSDHVWTVTYRDKDKTALTVSHFRAACAALKENTNGK